MLIKADMYAAGGVPYTDVLDHNDQCISLTGGWQINNGGINDNGIYLTNSGVTGYTAYTKQKIDLSNYNILVVNSNVPNSVYWHSELALYEETPPDSYSGTLSGILHTKLTGPNIDAYNFIDISNIDSAYIVLSSGRDATNKTSTHHSIRLYNIPLN